MIKSKQSVFSVVCTSLGVLLILAALLIVTIDLIGNKINTVNAEKALEKAENIITSVKDEYPEERYSDEMPSMEIEGSDIIGIIEVPLYGYKSVINAKWEKNKVTALPCRFAGCVYNRNLVIGVGEGEDQFGFAKTMEIGEYLYVTDMEGGRYCYVVEKIEHSKSAKLEKLQADEWDLTLFLKNSTYNDYLLLRCKVR